MSISPSRDLPNLFGAFRAQAMVSHLLSQASCLEQVLPALLETIAESLGFELATFWTVSEDAERLVCDGHHTDGKALRFSSTTQGLTLRRGECEVGNAWMDEELAWSEDIRAMVMAPRRAIAAAEGLRTVCATPVIVGGSVRAVLELVTYDTRPFEETTGIALNAIAGQIGQLMERELVEQRYHALSAMLEQQAYDAAVPVTVSLVA
jgi:GAF domain-containing protein